MYNDARGSGPFTTNPYLHLQWRLIALDWLYQRHFCFLPRIYCKKSASSIHAVPLAQLGVIKFVFLLDFSPHSFFTGRKSLVWSVEAVHIYRAQQKAQQKVNNGEQHTRREWGGFSEVFFFFFLLSLLSVFEMIEMKYRMEHLQTLTALRQKEFVAKMEKAHKRYDRRRQTRSWCHVP